MLSERALLDNTMNANTRNDVYIAKCKQFVVCPREIEERVKTSSKSDFWSLGHANSERVFKTRTAKQRTNVIF